MLSGQYSLEFCAMKQDQLELEAVIFECLLLIKFRGLEFIFSKFRHQQKHLSASKTYYGSL